MLKKIQLIIVVFLFLVPHAYTATITAASSSFTDVQTAINQAGNGDTVVVPAGTSTWTSMLVITKSIRLKGSGIDITTIKNGIGSNNTDNFVINLEPATPAAYPFMEITGFTFDGNNMGGSIRVTSLDNTFAFSNFRIHHNKLKNTPNATESYMSIRIKGNCFGLIDNNQFDNNFQDHKPYGNQDNSWNNYPGADNMGSANYLYIENNTSTNGNGFLMESGEGTRWVYRYNTVDTGSLGLLLDAHGNTLNRGCVATEVYENTFINGNAAKVYDLRGGVGIAFNNFVEGGSGANLTIQIREEDAYVNNPIDTTYPGTDPVTNSYLWNNVNTLQGNALILIREGDDLTNNLIEQNRDYWTDAEVNDYATWAVLTPPNSSTFTFGLEADRPGSSSDDDCYWATDTKKLYRSIGTNNWTHVYSPYTYPHPLNDGSSPPNTILVPSGLKVE